MFPSVMTLKLVGNAFLHRLSRVICVDEDEKHR